MLPDREALFATDRRSDISIEANEPIAEALGDRAYSFADYVTKAGAAAIAAYPELLLHFDVCRVFGDAADLANHKLRSDEPIGPLVQQSIRAIADEASTYLRTVDPDAFVTVTVTARQSTPRKPTGRERSQYRYWRGF